MEDKEILTKRKGKIAFLYLNRPEKFNALNISLLNKINSTLKTISKDDKIRVIILTGVGEKAFAAGADISEFSKFKSKEAIELSKKGKEKVFDFIEDFSKPVIAAINGYALGGGLELALSCDIRIASNNALMGFPETSLGTIPGYGGTYRLAEIAGKGIAKEMILTCRKISAKEALEIGLISYLTEKKELLDKATEVANQIMMNSPNAINSAIKAINYGGRDNKKNCSEIESKYFSKCFDHPEFKKGVSAFLNKQKPNF
ncbi:MAG: enoyl-CoA hydratase/isomerase family protein [Flavobacteriaceae bacterium]|tara:strand:- start:338 stop:1114 length:777 start_codon:yes stop_codon:yes gene_type:complete